ncbi:MAG: hypothetical protein RIR70_919 [Pseudomonadota bacterium]
MSSVALAHAEPSPGGASLKDIFNAAWARQPQAVAFPARHEAALGMERAARALTAEPATLALTAKSDQWRRNEGAAEREWGIAAPLWLPGERQRAGLLAQAERSALLDTLEASRLRFAGELREVFWAYQRARLEKELAATRLNHTTLLSNDVARRVRAGDLARADQHQAAAALSRAQAALAHAEAGLVRARAQWRLLAGEVHETLSAQAEAEPAGEFEPSHAALAELAARARVAQGAADLAATRRRAHPELLLAASRDRGAHDEAWNGKLVVGLRIPFGGAKHDAAIAEAKAQALEAEALLALQREQLKAEAEIARAKVASQRIAAQAASQRAELASQTRGFFEKSFALGQIDLPTRLRYENEAAEAEREAALAAMDLSAAISALRQAQGLLP